LIVAQRMEISDTELTVSTCHKNASQVSCDTDSIGLGSIELQARAP